MKKIDLSTTTEYEMYLLNKALWIWCAETGLSKISWPGWKVVEYKTDNSNICLENKCFLCKFDVLNLRDSCRSIIICGSALCLDGLFHDALRKYRAMNERNSWINQRSYQLACYRIALIPWSVKYEPDTVEYFELRKKLQQVYEPTFMPANNEDAARIYAEYRKRFGDV